MKFVNFLLKVVILSAVIFVLVKVLDNTFGDNDIDSVIYVIGILIFTNLIQKLFNKKELISEENKNNVQRENNERDFVEKQQKIKKRLLISSLVLLGSIISAILLDPRDPSVGLFVIVALISGVVVAHSLIAFTLGKYDNIFTKDLF